MKIPNPFKLFKKKEVKVYTPIDEESIKNNEIIKAQQQKIVSQESQLAHIYSKEKERVDKENDKDKEQETNKKINEQHEDLKANKYGKIIWLGNFYKDVLINRRKHFKKKPIEITDKNDEVVLGKWGDFGIMEGGKICMKDSQGNLVSYGKTLSQVLYKPDAFFNMVRRGRFTIPMDKDGNWMEDLEYKELPEPLDAEFDEETGKIKRIIWSRIKTSEVKKIIANKLEQINYLSQELEMKESVIIGLKSEIDDLRRTKNIYENESYIAQSELSKSLGRFMENDKKINEMSMNIVKLTELKALYENLLDRKDEVINNLIKRLELTGEPKLDLLKATIKEDLEFYKNILPDKVETIVEPERTPTIISKPGDIIKK